MSNDDRSNEYRGTGKWTTAIGAGLAASSIAGSIASVPAMLDLKKMIGMTGEAQEALLKSVARKSTVAQVVAVAALLGGAAWGWHRASAAKQDHEALVGENAELKQKLSWAERVGQQQSNQREIGR